MTGTRSGGLKAAETNRILHGEDFYARIGAKGGSVLTDKPRGFASMSIRKVKKAGRKGGLKSRRGPSAQTIELFESHKEQILAWLDEGLTMSQASYRLGYHYPKVLAKWLEANG